MSAPKNNSAILLAAAGVVALLAAVLLRPSGGPTQEEFAAVQAEVAALTLQVAELQARRGKRGPRVEGQQPAGSLSRSGDERRDPDPEQRMRARMRDAIEAAEPGLGGSMEAVGEAIEADPEVREKITSLVRDELEAERDERWERRRERWAERSEQRLDELNEQLALSPSQRTQLAAVLSDERDVLGELFRAAREDGSWMEAREQADGIKAANDQRARDALDDEQYTGWQAMRAEDEERRRR